MRRFSVFQVFAAVLILAPLAGWLGIMGLDRVEANRDFCISCHLPNGQPLHEPKHALGLFTPPPDSTAVHFQATQGREISCADCHRGEGARERAKVIWGSLVNTTRYFFADFEEPSKLAAPISNATCTRCHQPNLAQPDRTLFHGAKPHAYPIPVLCTDCHMGHGQGESRAAFLAREAAKTLATCGSCHDVHPPTPAVRAVVEKYALRP